MQQMPCSVEAGWLNDSEQKDRSREDLYGYSVAMLWLIGVDRNGKCVVNYIR